MSVENVGVAAFGALVLYLFGPTKGQDFLDRRFPAWPPGLVKDVAAFVLYVLIGGLVGTILMGPSDVRQAFLSGFTWVGALEALKGR